MRKYFLLGLIGVLFLVIAACGGDDATAVPAAAATAVPAAPVATQAPASGQAPAANTLQSIAAKFAGGPGAIYLGDLNQLVGPAATPDQGDFDGNVALGSLERHLYIYESDYYKKLVEKANFTNPTELVSSGEKIELQHVCINRALLPCKLIDTFYAPNVLERTNGQLNIQISSFPELGLAGPDTLQLVSDGTLSMVNIYGGYVGGDLPAIEAQYLWGVYADREVYYFATNAIQDDLDRLVSENSGGAKVVSHNWFAGADQLFFCHDKMTTLEDFKGVKTRSHGAALSDWIEGMGADAQFVAFSEVYTALERGILDCGVTGADPGFGQRWYEVTKYMHGPLPTFTTTNIVVNSRVWNQMPADLQQIMIEEGAKSELEALRLAAIQNEVGIAKNEREGLILVPFSPELQKQSFEVAALQHVVPAWVNRAGGYDSEAVQIFNEKVSPLVGVIINPDGSASITGAGATTTRAMALTLADIAATLAGGPGAIYVGNLNQMVGPAASEKQGDYDGNVPLASLQRHLWIYESDYYKALLEKARLTNPTELVSSGESIELQHACINRALLPCEAIATYFAPNLEKRTNGQLKIQVSSYPELGLAGPDTLDLVEDGTLSMSEVYGGYVGGAMPPIEIQNLWGIYPDRETEFAATALITPDLEKLIVDATGAVVINHNWYAGNDQFFFSQKALRTEEDFEGLKTRSHSAALSDWIEGMGADAQFVAFSEVYTALERGILEAGVTGGDAGFGQRWYEVTKYINGPLVSMPSDNNVVNGKVWASIPPDLQQIFIEEGAKSELEALRISSIQNEMGLLRNVDAGLEFIEFSDELKERSLNQAVMQHVIPSWVNRVGGGDQPIIKIFNEKVGPLVGLRINLDGSVVKTE